jgi:hypothetical protein
MTLAKIEGTQWAFNAEMAREGEITMVPPEAVLQRPQLSDEQVRDSNCYIRECAQEVQNIDKGFAHYLKYFRLDREVRASIQIEKGHFGEVGWGVLFEQGRHRCLLARTVSGKPEDEAVEDALWIACAEWANFELVVGKPKVHQETCFFTEYFTHFSEGDPNLRNMSGTQWYQEASPFRRGIIERFGMGMRSFANPPTLLPLSEGWERSAEYVARITASRRFQVPDGANWWSCGAPSFVPQPFPKMVGTDPNPHGLLASARALLQHGSRVLGGPGGAGTG